MGRSRLSTATTALNAFNTAPFPLSSSSNASFSMCSHAAAPRFVTMASSVPVVLFHWIAHARCCPVQTKLTLRIRPGRSPLHLHRDVLAVTSEHSSLSKLFNVSVHHDDELLTSIPSSLCPPASLDSYAPVCFFAPCSRRPKPVYPRHCTDTRRPERTNGPKVASSEPCLNLKSLLKTQIL